MAKGLIVTVKSIGLKLWAGIMALVIIVLILLWLFQIVFLESFYSSIRVSEIKKEGMAIAKLLGEGNKADFENNAESFAFNNNLSIEAVDLNGNTVYLTGSTGPGGQMPMLRNNARAEVFQQVMEGKSVALPLSHPRFGNKFILLGIPVKVTGEIAGVLFINMPMAPVEDTALILKKQLLYLTLILLAASVIISYILSRTFTRPILEIKKVSEKMASGDFSDSIKLKGRDEIVKLAETINHMGQELSKIEQLRKDLVANVSHELRTPLSLIRGYAETIRDVSGNVPEKREKQLNIIIDESERLSKIVDDILNLSQIQAGYLSLKKEQFNITDAVKRVVKRYDILSEKSGILITANVSCDIMIWGDVLRLEQVLYNLINNAFNHTPKGGSIEVKLIDIPETVRIEVSDTGTGISGEDIKNVWDRYYKVDKTRGRKMVGTGLGLAIVKSILEAHDALYGITSEKGAGTTFWFELHK